MHTLYDMYELCISLFKKPIKLLLTFSMFLYTETKRSHNHAGPHSTVFFQDT